MQIRSAHKDYYDYVAHIYGGGDPKNLYLRDFVIPDEVSDYDKSGRYESSLKVNIGFRLYSDYGRGDGFYQEFAHIAIAGKLYVSTREHKASKWNYAAQAYEDEEATPWRIALLSDKYRRTGLLERVQEAENEKLKKALADDQPLEAGAHYPRLVELAKEVKAPVFLITTRDDRYANYIMGRCPILKNYGIPSVLPAEQAYQEISMFLGSLNDPPDNMPPAPMTDIQKVESHGFDKRQSFRHRK